LLVYIAVPILDVADPYLRKRHRGFWYCTSASLTDNVKIEGHLVQ
jgi:hypothetical protein